VELTDALPGLLHLGNATAMLFPMAARRDAPHTSPIRLSSPLTAGTYMRSRSCTAERQVDGLETPSTVECKKNVVECEMSGGAVASAPVASL